ncbi:DUF2267 domain-containing protein [Acidimangrovimonas sediminis]|uniref:DUF2267 domain-containing protein n=1 Tax=Acidimangrovimonas sediminis TaxID=2056283 RepID=UPI000C7FD6C2|nr:DUF2267 domain-containing protein [Acidimangrovimonas sediminis]
MKITGITSLDHAPQVAAEWLNELAEIVDWPNDRARVYALLRETLHAVRDFLGPDEAADLAAQLPLLIRGVYFEGWVPSRTPARPRSKADFLARVAAGFTERPLENPEVAVAGVFDLLRRKLSAGELGQVAHSMRKSLRELWE